MGVGHMKNVVSHKIWFADICFVILCHHFFTYFLPKFLTVIPDASFLCRPVIWCWYLWDAFDHQFIHLKFLINSFQKFWLGSQQRRLLSTENVWIVFACFFWLWWSVALQGDTLFNKFYIFSNLKLSKVAIPNSFWNNFFFKKVSSHFVIFIWLSFNKRNHTFWSLFLIRCLKTLNIVKQQVLYIKLKLLKWAIRKCLSQIFRVRVPAYQTIPQLVPKYSRCSL